VSESLPFLILTFGLFPTVAPKIVFFLASFWFVPGRRVSHFYEVLSTESPWPNSRSPHAFFFFFNFSFSLLLQMRLTLLHPTLPATALDGGIFFRFDWRAQILFRLPRARDRFVFSTYEP